MVSIKKIKKFNDKIYLIFLLLILIEVINYASYFKKILKIFNFEKNRKVINRKIFILACLILINSTSLCKLNEKI